MANTSDLKSDIRTAVGTAGYNAIIAGHRTEQRVARGESRSAIRIAASETVDVGSNLSTLIVSVDLEIMVRAQNGQAGFVETAHTAIATATEIFADVAWWQALASVRSAPAPEITYEDEIDIEGEVLYTVIRADVVLEA